MAEKNQAFHPGDVPAKPGIYLFRDRFGQVIYVGKAVNLRKRMSQYFQPSRARRADPRQRSLLNSIADWEFSAVKNEDEALILESRLIKQYAPRYNVLMRDDKRFLMVKINLHDDFPRLELARVRKDDNCRYFGPFPKGHALRETVEFLTAYFGLRSCKTSVPNQQVRKHCLKKIVRDCSEPCAGKIDRQQYHELVTRMITLLEGQTKLLTAELEHEMQQAAAKKQFEKAARFRDVIANIEEVFGEKTRSFSRAAIPAPEGAAAVVALQEALGLKEPPNVIEAFDISNILGALAVGGMVCFENGKSCRAKYRRFKIRDVAQSDDFAMMHEVFRRHYGRKLREKSPLPDLILVDGGKGQLSAVLQALIEVGCPPLPVIGLAKKNEEIFLPGKKQPLTLDRHSAALRLLQAVRDEAHRFAVGYHRDLRSKRLSESLLDDIPGIGAKRKLALLKAFGSIARLRRATVSEIIDKVPGAGRVFAERTVEFIRKKH